MDWSSITWITGCKATDAERRSPAGQAGADTGSHGPGPISSRKGIVHKWWRVPVFLRGATQIGSYGAAGRRPEAASSAASVTAGRGGVLTVRQPQGAGGWT